MNESTRRLAQPVPLAPVRRPADGTRLQGAGEQRRLAATPRTGAAWDFGRIRVGAADDVREREAERAAGNAAGVADVRPSPPGAQSLQAHDIPAPASVRAVLATPGQPLDDDTRTTMERRLGFDFGRVRVHADETAAESARALNARAFSAGSHIVFGAGEFGLTESGRRLLAHELAHTVHGGDGVVRRAPAMHLALPRKELKDAGNDDVTEIVDKLPAVILDNQAVDVKTADVDGVKHTFKLAIHIMPGEVPATAASDAVTKKATTGAKNDVHTITIALYQKQPEVVRVLFHELIHARLLIDEVLPRADQSETYRRYDQQVQMATDPALLIVTGTTKNKDDVLAKISALRSWYVTFVAGFTLPPALAASLDVEFIKQVLNERFANQEAGLAKFSPGGTKPAVTHPVSNESVAKRYARTVAGSFGKAADAEKLTDAVAAARTRTEATNNLPHLDDLIDALAASLTTLFAGLDTQRKDIEDFKTAPLPAVPPGAGSSPVYPRPVDIEGKPVPAS